MNPKYAYINNGVISWSTAGNGWKERKMLEGEICWKVYQLAQ